MYHLKTHITLYMYMYMYNIYIYVYIKQKHGLLKTIFIYWQEEFKITLYYKALILSRLSYSTTSPLHIIK